MTRELSYEFELDDFQSAAISAADRGASVLVSAPTGSGKTVVAEHALHAAVSRGGRAFYANPIKALSNQKFNDLSALFGSENVGLLTGDNSIRGDAPIVVMTAEVLRNMIYRQQPGESGPLDGLRCVVLDEVHYIQDEQRGPVWEEIIIGCPQQVALVCLSATVSNAEQVGEWLRTVRGEVEVVVEKERPVPLEGFQVVRDRAGNRKKIVMTALHGPNGKPNPRGRVYDNSPTLSSGWDDGWWDDYYEPDWRFHTPDAGEVVRLLAKRDLLPAVYFVFSRKGCDKAAGQVQRSERLTTDAESERIVELAERRFSAIPEADRKALSADAWMSRIARGAAAHHAGLPPVFKEVVEECFILGLLKVVFATETLSVGMNMPARTAVLSSLSKFNGTGHSELTAMEYTQITGRAGRRGIDEKGAAVCLWSPYDRFTQAARLAGAKSGPLKSSFTPSYNSVANLASRFTRDEAAEFVSKSFAQFLAERPKKRKKPKTEEGAQQRAAARKAALMRLPNLLEAMSSVLAGRGFLDEGWNLTHSGEVLARISHDHDLLVADAITSGAFDGLSAVDLAAVASTLCYEPRKDDPKSCRAWPSAEAEAATGRLAEMLQSILASERKTALGDRGGDAGTAPEPGFAAAITAWTMTGNLSEALGHGFSAGDFIRYARRTADLLRQVAASAPCRDLARTARRSVDLVERGVVADTADLASANSTVGDPALSAGSGEFGEQVA